MQKGRPNLTWSKEGCLCMRKNSWRFWWQKANGGISLRGTLYKIVTNILINRTKPLMPNLISVEQRAFVPNRNILDNVIVAQEVFYSMTRASRRKVLMVIKSDMGKAHDRMSWRYLEAVLHHYGFHSKFIRWIICCVENHTFFVLINGCSLQWFHSSLGLKQTWEWNEGIKCRYTHIYRIYKLQNQRQDDLKASWRTSSSNVTTAKLEYNKMKERKIGTIFMENPRQPNNYQYWDNGQSLTFKKENSRTTLKERIFPW